jgi:hypothetical protein
MRAMLVTLGLVSLLAAAPARGANEPKAAAKSAATAPLFNNLGTYHHQITTRSPQAQRYFDQGLRLIYAFNHDEEAEAVYREDLQRNPENGWSLYGLAQSLRAQGAAAEAGSVDARFRKAWARADVRLTASRF